MSDETEESGLPELFARARALADGERADFVGGIERRDPAAASALRRLLATDLITGSLLERPAPEFGAESEPVPPRVGPYRIVREIGRGGMGRVFLAEQRGEDYIRRVAVKRLERRDGSPLAERRFRDEVRILAALDHVGIARFLDGGRDADGAAYLVLEFIEGLDLIAHARGRGLDLAARIRLFLDVLAAVEYAHLQRVIHRDLKPGNVLVGADGRPKLLDFGISKLLEPESGPGEVTRTEQRAFTPAYASPEQLRGRPLTVASDIYSLGVVLYELVSWARPFVAAGNDAFAFERAVLEEEPEPPSTAARRTTTTRPPGGEGPRQGAGIRFGRDLDAICLKALRKEPEHRYPSARAFAEDLERYLEGAPVVARRGGFAYRSTKQLLRHRRALAVAAGAVAATIFVLSLFPGRGTGRGAALRSMHPPPRPTLSRIGELSARFAEEPNRPEAGLELVAALLEGGRGLAALDAVTRLRQLPVDPGMSPRIDLAEAEAALAVNEYQRAAASATAALAGAERGGDAALARRSRLVHTRALVRLSPPAEVERRLGVLLAEAEAAGDAALVAEGLLVRADAARRGARSTEAEQLLAEAGRRARALGLSRLEVEADLLTARLEGESGEIDQALGRVDAALERARTLDWLGGEGIALALKITLLNWRGRDAEGLALFPLALEKLRQSGNRELLLATLGNLATIETERGDGDAAEAAIAEAERVAATLAIPRARARVHAARAYLAEQRGDYAGAKSAYESAIAMVRDTGAVAELAGYLSELAWIEASEGRADLAEVPAREAVMIFEKAGDERAALEVAAVLAWVAAEHGDRVTALRELARLKKAAGQTDSDSARFVILVAEAKILETFDEVDAAIALRRRAVEIAASFGTEATVMANRLPLARLLAESGERAEADLIANEVLAAAERLRLPGLARESRALLAAHRAN